mmetsp:Transcript_12389/g.16696  ORF Transcript_12389/g.16696 Transcript_12389/m.16696 type:complete len:147 (-) Transcript_12389:82-522(-)
MDLLLLLFPKENQPSPFQAMNLFCLQVAPFDDCLQKQIPLNPKYFYSHWLVIQHFLMTPPYFLFFFVLFSSFDVPTKDAALAATKCSPNVVTHCLLKLAAALVLDDDGSTFLASTFGSLFDRSSGAAVDAGNSSKAAGADDISSSD